MTREQGKDGMLTLKQVHPLGKALIYLLQIVQYKILIQMEKLILIIF